MEGKNTFLIKYENFTSNKDKNNFLYLFIINLKQNGEPR